MAVYHGPLLSNHTYNGTSGRVRTVIVPATQVLPVSTGHDPVHHQGQEAVSAGIGEDSRGKFVYWNYLDFLFKWDNLFTLSSFFP